MDDLIEPARRLRRLLDQCADLIVEGSNGTSIAIPAGERAKALASDLDLIRNLNVTADLLVEALQVLPGDAPECVSDIAQKYRIPVDPISASTLPILAIRLGAARATKALAFPPIPVILAESSSCLIHIRRSIRTVRLLAETIGEARERLLDSGEIVIEVAEDADGIPF